MPVRSVGKVSICSLMSRPDLSARSCCPSACFKSLGGKRRSLTSKDISETENLKTIEHDLEGSSPWPFSSQTFDGIVVANYLYRPLFSKILGSLAPKGVLIYQTFAVGNEKYGRPRNPEYLLSNDELLKVFGKHLHVVQYSHGFIKQPSPAIMQSICCINDKPLIN